MISPCVWEVLDILGAGCAFLSEVLGTAGGNNPLQGNKTRVSFAQGVNEAGAKCERLGFCRGGETPPSVALGVSRTGVKCAAPGSCSGGETPPGVALGVNGAGVKCAELRSCTGDCTLASLWSTVLGNVLPSSGSSSEDSSSFGRLGFRLLTLLIGLIP